MSSAYRTIATVSEGIYREKMSKFIAFAMPARTVEEARIAIDKIRNEYHDARHVCWAYMIGAARSIFMVNDNGEPSGTAGKPILGQINSFELTNVVVAVVRYFGGIKLGTSGLIGAYREATRIALSNAHIVEGFEEREIKITFGYLAMNDVMKLIKNLPVRIISQNFDNTCCINFAVRADEATKTAERFSQISSVNCEISDTIL